MALEKEIIFDNGSVASYHKIRDVNIDYNTQRPMQITGSFYVGVNVASYKDQNWRTDNPYSSMTVITYSIMMESSSLDSINREFLYGKLKENNTFSGSLDV